MSARNTGRLIRILWWPEDAFGLIGKTGYFGITVLETYGGAGPTNGPVAAVLLVYAKTSREKGAKGISAFIVEKNFPGFKVAQKLTKMGFRGSQTAELVFDNSRRYALPTIWKWAVVGAVTFT